MRLGGRCSLVDGGKASPAVHQDGCIRDSGTPDMVQHAGQGGGVFWDSRVGPTSEEVVIQGVCL